MTNTTNNTTMNNATVNNAMEAAMADMMNDFNQFEESANQAEQSTVTADEFVDAMDKEVEGAKATFFNFISKAGELIGYAGLKNDVCDILAHSDLNGKHSYLLCVTQVIGKINSHIELLELIGTEEELKNAYALTKGHSVFTKFFGVLSWIGHKVASKMRKLFHLNGKQEEEAKRTILRRIFGGVSAVAKVFMKVVRGVAYVAVFGASAIAAGLISAGNWIVNTVKTAWQTIVAKIGNKLFGIDTEFEDEFEFYEDEDEEEIIIERYEDDEE